MRYIYENKKCDGKQQMKSNLYDELCLSMYQTNRYYHQLYSKILDKHDLTYLQYVCLLTIYQKGPLKMTDIGEELRLASNTLTPVIDKLVQKQWITKVQNPNDLRTKNLSLTDNKLSELNDIFEKVKQMKHQLAEKVTKPLVEILDENQQLNAILQNLLQEQGEKLSDV